jgi:hypothetical protein
VETCSDDRGANVAATCRLDVAVLVDALARLADPSAPSGIAWTMDSRIAAEEKIRSWGARVKPTSSESYGRRRTLAIP